MSPSFVSLLIFGIVFVSALAAMRLRVALPEHHLGDATKYTAKLTMGLVATMVALVLGLLISSTKEAYDKERNEVTQMAARIICLDRILAGYGPESADTRAELRQTVEKAVSRMWPEENASHEQPDPSTNLSEALPGSVRQLSPQNDVQRAAKIEAAQIVASLVQMRWLIFEQGETSISLPMLVIVVCWLAMLFFSFGLFAPAHGTAVGALLVAALSVSGAIFLILELDRPFVGLIHISSKPMRNALAHLGK